MHPLDGDDERDAESPAQRRRGRLASFQEGRKTRTLIISAQGGWVDLAAVLLAAGAALLDAFAVVDFLAAGAIVLLVC